jgi:hypothetical protein
MTAINVERTQQLVRVDAAAIRARYDVPVALGGHAGSSCVAGASIRQSWFSRVLVQVKEVAAVGLMIGFAAMFVVGLVACVAAYFAI